MRIAFLAVDKLSFGIPTDAQGGIPGRPLAVDKPHRLGSGGNVGPKEASHRRGNCVGAWLSDAPHRHAQVLGLYHHQDAPWVEGVFNGVGNLSGEPLLHLGHAGIPLHHPGQLGQPSDASVLVGDVAHMGLAQEGNQMVLAQRVHGNVSHQDHLVVISLELAGQVRGRILVQPSADLGVHAGHPPRCVQQAVSVRVLAYGSQDLSHRGLNPGLVY